MTRENIKFYCMKGRHKVRSNNYRIVRKKTKRKVVEFAVSKCPKHNAEMWKIIGNR